MHSKQKGAIAELSILTDLHKKGLFGATTNEDFLPFDLIAIDNELKLYKIQVKWCPLKYGSFAKLYLRNSMSNKTLTYKKSYTSNEVDIFGIYVPELDECFYIPFHSINDSKIAIILRLDKPKNNQKKNIRMLYDFKSFPKL